MRIIKVFLILFPILLGLSISSSLYFDNLASKVEIPKQEPLEKCNFLDENGCFTNVEWGLKYFSDEELIELTKNERCLKNLIGECQAVKEVFKKTDLFIQAANAEKKIYDDYLTYAGKTSLALGVLTLSTFIAYLAVKFSIVRTMAAVSLIWIGVSVSENHRLDDILLVSSPVILYWLYRFIRYGPSKMLKDK
jgi:hypothetical protein